MLSRIAVSGGTDTDKQTFYTALYHTLLQPNVFSDANGEYIGFDNQVHTATYINDVGQTIPYTQYANYSGWDIYRTQIPLLALLAPRETSDMMQSLVEDAQQSGWLPRWALANILQMSWWATPPVLFLPARTRSARHVLIRRLPYKP